MKTDGKFLQWLKRPKGVWLAVIYIVTLAVSIGAIVVATVGTQNFFIEILSYCLYAFAAVFLGYSVYTVVIYAPFMKRNVISLLKKRKFTAKLLENYGFKTLIFSSCSSSLTLIFAVMNLVSAIRYRLLWYYAISAYYFILVFFRAGIILSDVRHRKRYENSPLEYSKSKWRAYFRGGLILSALEIAMAVAVTEAILSHRPIQSGMIMAISNAAYTFYKMTMAIYNLFKARRFQNPVIQALRNINFADACMSIVSLTVIMLTTFGDDTGMIFIKAGTGFAACAVTIATATIMIIHGHTKLKQLKGTTDNEPTR